MLMFKTESRYKKNLQLNPVPFTQNFGQCHVFRFVPLQDFTSLSDIDWNKSIPEIDNQLSAKYRLTNEEIAFVESMIKPM